MTLRQRMEENVVLTVLSLLLSGFLAGLGTYEGILRIAGKTADSLFQVWIIKGTYDFEGGRGDEGSIEVYLTPAFHEFSPDKRFMIKLFSTPEPDGRLYLPGIIIEHDGFKQFAIPRLPLPDPKPPDRSIDYPTRVILRKLPEDASEDSYEPKDEPLQPIN